MGYGVIISSDDVALRAQLANDPASAAADLIALLGTDSYPMTDDDIVRVGAWARTGSYHASELVPLTLSADRLARGYGADDGWFISVLSGGKLRTVEQQIMRHPHRHTPVTAAAATGGDWVSAAFGPDCTTQTVRSAWWAYADSLPWTPDTATCQALGSQLALMTGSRLADHAMVTVGSGVRFAAALNRLGGIGPGGGACQLYWSGNRMARHDDLLADEQARSERQKSWEPSV